MQIISKLSKTVVNSLKNYKIFFKDSTQLFPATKK